MKPPEQVSLLGWLGRKIDEASQPDNFRCQVKTFERQKHNHREHEEAETAPLPQPGEGYHQQNRAESHLNPLPGLEIPAILLRHLVAKKCSGLIPPHLL